MTSPQFSCPIARFEMERMRVSLPPPGSSGQDSPKPTCPKLVADRIQILFSAFRRDDFANPEGFVTQLGVVLSDYPEEVIRYVTDPRTGLQRKLKFPPSIAEVIEACDRHVDYLRRIEEG